MKITVMCLKIWLHQLWFDRCKYPFIRSANMLPGKNNFQPRNEKIMPVSFKTIAVISDIFDYLLL